ncbi:hypothetical protein TTHERM_00273380 (macronuclear) [Tetrahymena thermophila SB210]|uniref:H-type lectin domain-containing protein n=1 Tax=Tetrahymena thermophila (strain SB210) TaxID=312017 RepID=I7M7S0_TETTS|nr:hypothetical protein TTHERM_00273380 [Tetrahymena thermophila SB210]EAR95732.2 hypothetical protein TTHERM_00273380 [Tetrahymena thermophila SB210]|eukprot:XP_001015977.2 hypothetical protein TTHERM_00273380 [Tetrahymena thermophila SB210]
MEMIPIVILGIEFYNNYWNPVNGVDFVLSATQITKTSCTVQTARNNNSQLDGISVSALVIDTSQFPFFVKNDQQIQNIQFTNYVYQKEYSFSSNIQNQSNKCVSVILTGWKSAYDSSNKVFALTIQVVIITDSGYTIQISTAKDSQQVINVSFTVLEYIQNPPTSIYGIVSNYDTQYQQPTTQNCFFNDQCPNSLRYFPVQFNVFIQNSPPSGNYQNFFVSLNQLYFNTVKDGSDLRISIINLPVSSNKIQYQYQVWDGAQCLGATSTALYFYKKTCPSNQFIKINSNSCSSVCQIQDPSNSSICLDCPSGQYFLQDQNICQATQPNGYSCSVPSAQFNFKVCQTYRISNWKCYSQSSPPNNTFCDWNILQCTQCTDSSCKACSDPTQPPQKCLSCDASKKMVLFSGKCYSQSSPPLNTFCDWNKLKCTQCTDPSCLVCSDTAYPSQKCFSCDVSKNMVLFQDKCYSQSSPPHNAFCDWNKLLCTQCNDSRCLFCSDPNSPPQICLSCQINSNYILKEGKCLQNCQQIQSEENEECSQNQIIEIQETYKLNNDPNYQKYQNLVVGSSVLAVTSLEIILFLRPLIQILKLIKMVPTLIKKIKLYLNEKKQKKKVDFLSQQYLELIEKNQNQSNYTDQVPIVYFQQNIWLFKFGDGTYQGSQTIDYSANSFQQIPIVILGIQFYNNQWNPSTGVDFVLSAADITKTSCTVQTARNNNSILAGISASALVIDTSQFPFFIKSDQQIQNIKFTNYVYQKVYSFSTNIQNQSNKFVSVILTGWKSAYDSSNKVFALTIQVVGITDSGYTIQISTAQDSQQIINVYFTVLEYIQNPPTSIYGIVSNYDKQYQQPTTQNCFFNDQCSNSQRFFPVQFNVLIQNSPPSGNYQNFFVSLNQLYFNTVQDDQALRITIINKPISSNKIQYQYSVWDGAQCLGATSTAIYFYKKTCPSNQLININSNSCSSVCLIQDPSNSSICLDCPSGQYFLQDQNICQATQPNGYSCSVPSAQSNFNVCQNCNISNCKLCSQISNQFTCTQCVSQYFLYNNQCQQTQPSNTFCDIQSFICSKCLDESCLTCSDPSQSSPQCLTCDTKQNQILYKGKCYSQSSPPNNTFCDWSKLQCILCNDSNCLSCSDPAKTPQICNKCVPNQSLILFQGKCYNQNNPPPNTYCDWTKLRCSLCVDSKCLTCSDPSLSPQQCLKCDASQKQVLYQGECYNQQNQPSNTFCDWNTLQCSNCNDSKCLFCSDPNLPPQLCLQCDVSLQKQILYQGKCFSQSDPPPQNAFCNWDKLQCSKCADNICLTCSDPSKPPQKCLSCDTSQKQILYQGKCFNKNNPPSNTYCDWNKLNCTQCTDPSCLYCSDTTQSPQKCLSCDASKKMVLFQDKCYSQSSPPQNAFCDWNKLLCTQCNDSSCLKCSDPNLPPQLCLLCDASKNMVLFQDKCYPQSSPPPNTFCDWNKLLCTQCNDSRCLFCSDSNSPPQICLSCQINSNYILKEGKCIQNCQQIYIKENEECSQNQIIEIQETYQLSKDPNYQKYQNLVVGSSVLAITSLVFKLVFENGK